MLVDLGVNPLPVKGFRSQWIYTQFDQLNLVINAWSNCVILGENPLRLHCLLKALDLNGFTPNLTSRIRPVKLGVNPLRLHCLLKALGLNRFTPNLTGPIGCKSIEIMSTKFDQAGIQCNLSEFPPSLTGRIGCKSIEITLPVKGIRPVEFDRASITGQIG